ncbi:MAG: prolyl-tRNA synthetase associated domain-containing protein [Lachnospiraceae bacterium]|nr:prolyl-tRNA synthetase associated domain-containing protein [Lachnospiraceae bacterium]
MKLEKGSPTDIDSRLEKEKRCYKLLDELGLEYYRCDHPDSNANTMEDCLKIDSILEAVVCKNLFLCNRQHTQFYLLMMPGDKVFKTKELSGQLGCARLSFAEPEYMEKYLDITPGSVSILGLMNDHDNAVQLLVDKDVLEGEYVGCHPCINTTSLKIRKDDMFGPLLNAMHHDMIAVELVGESYQT